MRKSKTYIINWNEEPSLFTLNSFERRFGHGISDERTMLMPYFSLHVFSLSKMEEGDEFYLFDDKSLILKGLILSRPYKGYKGDSDEYFADIYPEFAIHPSSDQTLKIDAIKKELPTFSLAASLLDKKTAEALDAIFESYRDSIVPLDSDFSSTPLSLSSHVRFPAITSKSPTITEKVDYRRYLLSKSRIIEGYKHYSANGLDYFTINVHNFRLLKAFFAIAKALYQDSAITLSYGLQNEDYCMNEKLKAKDAEQYLESERKEIEENTYFNLMAYSDSPRESVYITPDKTILLATGNKDTALEALESLAIKENETILFMSSFITEESKSIDKAYDLVEDVAEALPDTFYFGEEDDEEDSTEEE